MSRLFIGPREQMFIKDITAEFSHDVVGSYIIYYPVSVLYTKIHTIYEEAIEKIFENPIKLDVLAGQPDRKNITDSFGTRVDSTIELFVQPKDLINKGLEVFTGDFFMYGDETYEIIGSITIENIYGQVEYDRAVKIIGKLAKAGEFNLRDLKNTLYNGKDFETSSVQKTFIQQRGQKENEQGPANDRRELREVLGENYIDLADTEGPRKVDIEEEENSAIPRKTSKFYNE
jgi:hypothetical protein